MADPDIAAQSQRIVLQGDVPQPIDPPSGCPFCTRCRYCEDACEREMPAMREIAPEHFVACHRVK